MAEKVTVMVLKANLQCPCCYKKVKKLLCKFPQIRDQVYDEKANTVTITVVCCSPEKIRDKLCCKGAPTIKSIEIKEPPIPKPPEKPKQPEKPKESEKPKEPPKPKEPEQPKEPPKPKDPEKPKEPPKPIEPEKPKDPPKPKEPEKPKEPPKPKDPPAELPKPAPNPCPPEQPMGPVDGYPPIFPVRTCCGQCYEGYGGGPCYHGHGCPPPCYDGYYGHGCCQCEQWRECQCHRVSRCDYYFSEENPQSCSVM